MGQKRPPEGATLVMEGSIGVVGGMVERKAKKNVF